MNIQIFGTSKCFDTKLKTDLVISFSCCTVADCRCALFFGNFNESF